MFKKYSAFFLVLLLSVTSSSCQAKPGNKLSLYVDASKVQRELPDRALFGQNLSFANHANGAWDVKRKAFKQPFWNRLVDINPGLLRFPGGNWSYGYHFNLARKGVKHWVNTREIKASYRPQDFLKTIHQLGDTRALIHLSPIWSSPQEAAAFVAYMIGDVSDKRKIGMDSWHRKDPQTGEIIDWHNVGYWAKLRELDGQKAYQGTLYFQLGNEEWFGWCKDRVCDGKVDYYGRRRPVRQVTIVDAGLKDPVSGTKVEAYWPNYRAVYQSIRGLFNAQQVKIGAMIYAKPDGAGGADTFLRTAGRKGKKWNVELLQQLNNDAEVTADFLTIHTYMYDKLGWQKDFPEEGAANLLFASDHFKSRINKIFSYANSPQYPVMVTEFNVHLKNNIPASSLLSALFYLDFTMQALGNESITGLVRWQLANWKRKVTKGQALIVTDAGPSGESKDIWKMGPYYAAKLLGKLDKRVLPSHIQNAPTFRPRKLSGRWRASGDTTPWWKATELPLLTSVATLSSDGKTLSVLVLNKSTKQDFTLEVNLNGFAVDSRYDKIVLNSIHPGGHDEIFRVNPWRNLKKSKCMPVNGGCSKDLAAEVGENINLVTTTHTVANQSIPVSITAHSATLLQFSLTDVK